MRPTKTLIDIMTSILAKAASPTGLRTVATCLGMEALVLALIYALTGSLGLAVILSIIILGPLSLFFALPLYRHFSQRQ